MARPKRVQRVPIYGDEINDFFRGDLVAVEGLPDDASLVDTYEAPAKQCYYFIFESEEFPVVEEGETIPEHDIITARRRVNDSTHWVCENCHEKYENGDVKSP